MGAKFAPVGGYGLRKWVVQASLIRSEEPRGECTGVTTLTGAWRRWARKKGGG
ncbi:hypothetical protein CPB86DRAFT_787711 [Serendipita vermifera]|nr:hypothetical protein CPB86DRAFT_787711 [Serendipita vermifera]